MAIYFFDKDQTLIKIVPESATFKAIQTQELDDDSLLKDTLSVTNKGDEKLLDAEYMAVKSYTGNAQTLDMYRIITDTTPNKTMNFTGMSLAPYELNGYIIQDLRPTNQTLEYTINRVLTGTDWRLGYIEDGLSNVTTTFYYVSAKEALKELQSLVGCEFVFKVEISGQKITDKWIEVYKEMGNRTKKRFNYGTNALTVVRETNKTEIYTALIGRGKGEEVSSADDNASGQAGYGRKITFEDIEWSTAKGNPVNKPIGQYYLELPQATQAYGIKNIDGTMTPRIGIVDFDDEEDKNRLINLTYQQLLVSSRPKVLFKSSVANIGATGIGDTVTIHRHDLNIHYQTRVRKIVRDKLNDNKTQIELGDAVVTPSTKRAKQNNATIKNLNQELEKVKTDVIISQTSADGKNTINYGSTEPERKRTGDTWYRPHPSIAGETQMLVWNGNAWELVLDTSDLTSVSREVEAVAQIANGAVQAASDADTKAKSAIEKAGANSDLIDEHKKRLDSLRVGNRNYVYKDSIRGISLDLFNTDDFPSVYIKPHTGIFTSGIKISNTLFEVGETYTLSFTIQNLEDGEEIYRLGGHANAFETLSVSMDGVEYNGQWSSVPIKTSLGYDEHKVIVKLKFIGKSSDSNLYIQPNRAGTEFRRYHALIKNININKGTVASDWTPALEDIDAELNNVATEIGQMRNDLNTVSDTAQSSLNIIGIDSGNMYTKNRRLGLKSQEIKKGGTAKVYHNGDGFEAGNVYTLSFDVSCISQELFANVNFLFDQFEKLNLNIVHLGDSITMGYGRDVKVPDIVGDELGSNVLNGGFGGTMANLHPNAEFAKLSLVNLVDSIVSGDFSLQRNMNLPGLSQTQNKAYMGNVYGLEDTDFDSVDAIIISYGVNDWTDGTPIDNANNTKDRETYLGALRYSIDKLRAKYPHIKIMVTEPIFWSDPNTGLTSENRKNSRGNLLTDFVKALNDVLSPQLNVPIAQTYKGTGMNATNISDYFYPHDGTHPNDAGNIALGRTLAREFERLIDIQPRQDRATVEFEFEYDTSDTAIVNFEFEYEALATVNFEFI